MVCRRPELLDTGATSRQERRAVWLRTSVRSSSVISDPIFLVLEEAPKLDRE
jgi:hypothetical protein